MELTAGTRIRVNARSPWPERVGCEGVIVGDPGDGLYPFAGLGRGEVVVLLDDDPFERTHSSRGWTCVMDAKSLDRA